MLKLRFKALKPRFKVLIVFAVIVGLFLAIWGISLLACEIQTALYKDVIDAYKCDEDCAYWVDGYSYAKVLFYTGNDAVVYYINGDIGMIVEYVKNDGDFKPIYWDTLWSWQGGNADRVIWPYWYHSPLFHPSYS